VISLFELAGGDAGLRALTERFYERVFEDPVLLPLFQDPGAPHAERLALWFAELLGGPPEHTLARGGYEVMLGAHENLRISEPQRQAWVGQIEQAARDVGLPVEFQRRFRPYVDGGSTLCMRVSWPTDERWPR